MTSSWKPPSTFDFSGADEAPDSTWAPPQQFDFGDEAGAEEYRAMSFDRLTAQIKPITSNPSDSFNWFMSQAARVGQSIGWLTKNADINPLETIGEVAMPASKLLPDAGKDIIGYGTDVIGQSIEDRSRQSSEYWLDKVGEDFKARANAGIDDPEFGVTTIYAAALGSLPEMMLTMGSGAVAGKIASMSAAVTTAKVAAAAERGSVLASKILRYSKYAPVVAGAAVGGGTEGLLAAGASGVAMEARVNAMSHDELINSSDRYVAVYEAAEGMEDGQRKDYAKRTIAEEMARATASWVGLSTAMLGAPTGGLMGFLGGKAAKKVGADAAASALERSVTGQAVTGFASEGAQEFLQEGSQQFLQNLGLREYADKGQSLSEGVLSNAVIGGLVGGVMGGSITPLVGAGARKNARDKADATGGAAEFKFSRNPILEAKITEQLQNLQTAGVPAGEFQKVARWASTSGGRSALEFSKALEQLIEDGVAPEHVEAVTGDDFDDNGMLTEAAYHKDASRLAFDVELRFRPSDEERAPLTEALAQDGVNPYAMDDGSLVVPQSAQGEAGLRAVAESIKRRVGIDFEITRKDDEDTESTEDQGAEGAATEGAEGAGLAATEGVLREQDIRMSLAGKTPQEKLADIHRMTAENKPVIDSFLRGMDAELGTVSKTNIKSDEAILAKAERPSILADKPWHTVEHVRDTLRFKVVANSIDDLESIGQKIADQGWEVIKVDTAKLTNPKEWGWRFVGVDMRMPNGQLVEAYVPMRQLEAVKKENHKLYEKWRNADLNALTPEQRAEFIADVRQSRDSFDAAYREALGEASESAAVASANRFAASLSSSTEKSLYVSSTEKSATRVQRPSEREAMKPSAAMTSARPSSATKPSKPSIPESSVRSTQIVPQDKVYTQREVPVTPEGGEDALEAMGRSAASHPQSEHQTPTERELAAGNYPKGHGVLRGTNARENIPVSIENVPGSIRRAIGGGWSRKMKHWYGYVRGTKDVGDGKLDVFIGRNAHDNTLPVFVVRQMTADGVFDEPKVMLGYGTEGEAKNAYLSEYPPNMGPKLFGGITRLSRAQFADYLETGDTDVPPNPISKAPMLSLRRRTTSDLLRNLTEQERKKITEKVAEKILSHLDQMPSSDEMAAIAFAGKAKRGWYEQASRSIVDVFGPDAPRFAALLAAMSPQTSVESNLRNALNVWKNWNEAGRPTDREDIIDIMAASVEGGGGRASVLGAWINNSIRALAAEDPSSLALSGPKVNSFMRNLMGDVNEVTNDAWMANWAMVNQTIFKGSLTKTDSGKVPGYMAMNALVREAADILTQQTGETWTPAEVQETVWSWSKTLAELADSAGEIRNAIELVKDNAVTDELVASTPDFGSMFTNEEYGKILEDAGYEEQVKRLRAGLDSRKQLAQKSIAREQAGPFDRDTQKAHEVSSAQRIEITRRKRGQEVSEEIPFSLRQRDQTNSAAFKKWFGKSKVVDSNGQPLVVYHGTNAQFTSFDQSKTGANFDAGSGAFFFTPDIDFAEQVADHVAEDGGEANIVEAYLSLQNPLVRDFSKSRSINISSIISAAKAGGHDGVIAINAKDSMPAWRVTQYIAFSPEQITIRTSNEQNTSGRTPSDEAVAGKQDTRNSGKSAAGKQPGSGQAGSSRIAGVPSFAGGKVQKNAVSVLAVHYGEDAMNELDPAYAGSGSAGAERRRFGVGVYGKKLKPGDMGRRLYFYEQSEDTLPTPERAIQGKVAHRAYLDNVYDLTVDPDHVIDTIVESYGPAYATNMDVIEETINELGYDGLITEPMPGMHARPIVLFGLKKNVPVATVDALAASLAKSPVSRDFMLENPRRALTRPGWAVVTGTRESIGPATDQANVYANNQLRGKLLSAGIPFIQVEGTYKGVDQGANFMVFTDEATAVELGREFGQESVLTNRGLVGVDGSIVPADHTASTFGETAREQDFYSTLPNGKSFSMGLNFDATVASDAVEEAPQQPVDTVGDEYVAKVLDIVDTVAGSIKGAPVYHVVKNELELPYHPLKAIYDMEAIGLVEGFLDPVSGEVYIIANNIQLRDGEDLNSAVERIFAEETLGHFGLRAVFGTKAMNSLLDQVWRDHANSPAMRAIVNEYVDYYGDLSSKDVRRRMADEFLSKQKPDSNPSLWSKLVAWAREQLRHLGYVRQWSDNDISTLMDRVFNAIRDGEVPTSIKKLDKALVRVDGLHPTVVAGGRVTTYGAEGRTVKDRKFEVTFDDGMEGDLPAADVSRFSGSLRSLASFLAEEGKQRIVMPDGLLSTDELRASGLPFYSDAGATIIDIPAFAGESAPMFSMRNRRRGSDEVEAILGKTIQMHESEMTFGQRMRQYVRELTGYFGSGDTWLELKTGWIDSATSIEKLERGLFDGKLLDASESAYKMISLVKNLPQLMGAVSRVGVPVFQDGSFVRMPGRKGLYEIFSPLFHTDDGKNLLHLWEGYAVARRSSQLINQTNPDGTSKEKLLTSTEIAKLLALENDHPIFRKVFDEWQEFNRQLLDLAVDRGALDKETADVWKQNDYVPFFRVDEEEDTVMGITRKRGLSGQKVSSKRLTGSDRRIQPVLENIMMNSASILEKVYKNEAMNRIVAIGDGVVMEREPMRVEAVKMSNEDIARQLAKAGLFVGDNSNSTPEQRRAAKLLRSNDIDYAIKAVEQMTPEQKERWTTFFRRVRPQGHDVVSVMVAGKPVWYRVHDPLVLRAIMDMTPTNFGGLIQTMGGAKKLLTHMVTLDPAFMAANWMRDTLSSLIVVNEDFRPFRDAPKGAAEVWTDSGLAVDLAVAGGMTGGFYNPTQDFADVMHEVAGATVLTSPKKMVDTYRKIGMVSEQVNRMAIARGVLRRGGSMAEAAYQAQDVLNFSQSGDAVAAQLLIRTVPFLNARIQGLYRLWKGARGLDGRDPKKAAMAFLLKGLFLTGMSMLLALKNRGDERYEKLPDFQKDTYWHFFVGDQHYAIPKPFEVGTLFSTLPERAVRLLAKDDSARTTLQSIQRALTDTFAFNPVPQLFKPVVEQWANRSFFTGRQIVGMELEGLEPVAQYNPWTSETARGVANVVDAVLPDRMLRYVPETLRSPTRLEFAMRAYLGTIGAYALQLSDAALRATGAFPEAPALASVRDVPVIGAAAGRFVRGEPELESSNKYADDLYDALSEADDAYRTFNAYVTRGQLEAAQQLTGRRMDALTVRPILHDFREAASEINRQQRLIMNSDMSPQEKREALDELTRTKNKLMKEAVPYLGMMNY